jgi:BirA family biotin operon repressor/biotin-[acetyl-CoA-carboxylase] ligase
MAMAEAKLRECLSPLATGKLSAISLLQTTSSTNDYLLQLAPSKRHAHAVFADYQSNGRGRRGRRWQSPPGCNIYFSLGWSFSPPDQNFLRDATRDLACLPLVAGVAAAAALQSIGATGLGLKWPNDIHADGKKLGGILVESTITSANLPSAVVGIGLNVLMPESAKEAEAIDQPWTSVDQLPGFRGSSAAQAGLRERLAGALLDQLICNIIQFEMEGFGDFARLWSPLDVLKGRMVNVSGGREQFHGLACGIDLQGRLLLEEKLPDGTQRVLRLNAGEVSVRLEGL